METLKMSTAYRIAADSQSLGYCGVHNFYFKGVGTVASALAYWKRRRAGFSDVFSSSADARAHLASVIQNCLQHTTCPHCEVDAHRMLRRGQ